MGMAGKAVSVPNHPEIAAAIIKPYVRSDVYFMIKAHQDFQGRHYDAHFGADPEAREQYRDEPWYALAAQFADDWDHRGVRAWHEGWWELGVETGNLSWGLLTPAHWHVGVGHVTMLDPQALALQERWSRRRGKAARAA